VTENDGQDRLAQQILDYVYHPEYQPTKPKGIHQALQLTPDEYPAVRKAVKRLVLAGQLAYGGNHLVVTPEQISGDPKLTRGTFRQAAAGFGFVRPIPTGKLGTTEDIFIPAHATGSAKSSRQRR
jgi:ribonuclease R